MKKQTLIGQDDIPGRKQIFESEFNTAWPNTIVFQGFPKKLRGIKK